MLATGRPTENEHAPYFAGYIALVPETDVMSALEAQGAVLQALARSVAAEKETFAYAPGKWTVRQVLGHIIDAERVFGHRAFCISRREPATLPAFDENAYVAASTATSVPLAELADEFALVRTANLLFLRRLDHHGWARLGTVSSGPASVRALGFIMAGHVRHHLGVLAERYAVRAA